MDMRFRPDHRKFGLDAEGVAMSPTIEKDKVQPAPRQGRDPVRVTADTARQGPAGRRLLYVLIGGMLGVLVACGVVYLFWSNIS
jgi:hypothetical protein